MPACTATERLVSHRATSRGPIEQLPLVFCPPPGLAVQFELPLQVLLRGGLQRLAPSTERCRLIGIPGLARLRLRGLQGLATCGSQQPMAVDMTLAEVLDLLGRQGSAGLLQPGEVGGRQRGIGRRALRLRRVLAIPAVRRLGGLGRGTGGAGKEAIEHLVEGRGLVRRAYQHATQAITEPAPVRIAQQSQRPVGGEGFVRRYLEPDSPQRQEKLAEGCLHWGQIGQGRSRCSGGAAGPS